MSVQAETASSKPPLHRFAVLDGLRALAALIVVTDHVLTPTLRALLPHRELAVDFFFVLSGFVVMHAYSNRLLGPGRIGAFAFMRLRVLRFWPMLTAAFALAILAVCLREPGEHSLARWIGSIVFGLAFLPTPQTLSLHDWTLFPLVGPAYTLFFELFANLVLVLVITRLTPRLLGFIVTTSAIGLAVVGLHHGSITMGWHVGDFVGGFIRVLFSFFAGVAVYRFWRSRAVPALPAWSAFLILLLAHAMPAVGVWFAPYQVLIGLLLFPLLVLLAAGASAAGFAERIFLRLGGLSYGFYLLHQPLNEVLEWAFHRLGVDAQRLDVVMFALVVASTLALTMLVERNYEIPFRRWLTRGVAGAPAAVVAPRA